jgi:FkbM family methyltransferase
MAVASGRGTGGSVSHLARNLFAPTCTISGGRRVERVDPARDGVRAVWIKGVQRPIFLPESFDLHCIRQVLAEETYSWNWHYYCTPETPVEKGDVVFDCGAAEGLFTLLARQKGAKAVVFEPHPMYFAALEKTFADDTEVHLVNAALGEECGEAFLSRDDIASKVDSDDGYPIRVQTIDSAYDRMKIAPTYLKADIEGFEAKMLAGAAETIAHHHPKIAITTYHDENDPQDLAAMLRRFWPGYRIRLKGICNRRGKPVMLHAW